MIGREEVTRRREIHVDSWVCDVVGLGRLGPIGYPYVERMARLDRGIHGTVRECFLVPVERRTRAGTLIQSEEVDVWALIRASRWSNDPPSPQLSLGPMSWTLVSGSESGF